jgi:ornithine cyclodeaminase/alanine dehydrogenase-like protein (mu-crystallin family)
VVIGEEHVRLWLTPARLIGALEQGFRRHTAAAVVAPRRTGMRLPDGSTFLSMPCYDASQGVFGVKLVTIGNGSERVRADYVLYEASSRERLAIISANFLTDIRTACISAIATKLVMRAGSTVLGIFGTGRQAWAHVEALSAVLPFAAVLCCGSERWKSEQFAQRVKSTFPVDASACRTEECVAGSDVICCCTTSSTPLFEGSWLRPGTHLNLVGAFERGAREVDGEAVRRSRVFVENYDGVLSEGGDIATALEEKTISRHTIGADLHELLSGKKPGRQEAGEITLFKSVGDAYEDLIAATLVYHAAMAEAGAEGG